ncbi:hypothetical protein FS837_003459 [Tulasnella sp. UAMH 9824]|nr:hypothetical protein FS837_003459 [Tulasnella sp. UAMH 9824]
MNNAQSEPKLTAIPEVPQEFGEDGGHFYKRYDALAAELDEEIVKRLKSQLDSTLIFAGLFAGVNSAFLALTLPEMRADPADDTNALLLQLVTGVSSTIRSADDLPSATFTPPPGIIPVNVLFSIGLTVTILVSFFSILGQQWLIYYSRRSGVGPENYRWEQLQRYLGARGYGLELVLDDVLPALLQSVLVIFSISFVVYLQTLSKTVCYVVAALITVAAEIVFFMSFFSMLDKWCPFKTPWARLMGLICRNPLKYWLPLIILALVGLAFFISLYIAALVIAYIAALYLLLPEQLIIIRASIAGNEVGSGIQSLVNIFPDLTTYFLWGLTPSVRLGKPAAVLEAAAAGRVLSTSWDFNTLVYTAMNIWTMNARDGARFLLRDEAVWERLQLLIESSDRVIASAFCYAFSHLLLGGQSLELFVSPRHRVTYPIIEKYLLAFQYNNFHPLKERVVFICEKLRICSKSSEIGSDTVGKLLPYFELLELILDEESNDQQLSKWVDGVVQNQSSAEVSTPLVTSLVAATTRILHEGIDSIDVPSELPIHWLDSVLAAVQKVQQRRVGHLQKVQQRRVVMTKELVRAIGWNMQLLPSDPPKRGRKSALEFIEEAFSAYTPQSPRHPNNTEIWLLEQALLFSTQSQHQRGWKFVAESSIDLLPSFDKLEEPTPDSANTEDSQKDNPPPPFDRSEDPKPDSVANTQSSQKDNPLPPSDKPEDPTLNSVNTQYSHKDNRRRCAKILSQCIQSARDHLVPKEFIQTVSPALHKLEAYWDGFKDDFTQNPDLDDSDMLSSWFEIRAALDRPDESTGWGAHNVQPFGEAYPILKIGFDAIASVMPNNAPRVDQSKTEHPGDSALDGQAGRTEPDEAVADSNTPKPEEHFGHSREGLGESREHEGARGPNCGERNEQPDEQAGHSNSTPMKEDE